MLGLGELIARGVLGQKVVFLVRRHVGQLELSESQRRMAMLKTVDTVPTRLLGDKGCVMGVLMLIEADNWSSTMMPGPKLIYLG